MIELKNVTKTYENGFTALEDLSLRIESGEFVFIVGPSGSGKSTLSRLLTCEVKPTSGTVIVDESDLGAIKRKKIPYYRRKLGLVFQDFRILSEKTVYENVAFALRVIGEPSAGIRMKVNAALKMVELSDVGKNYPSALSEGELQRVALARALAGGPGILIADEPTGNIDPVQSREFMELLCRIHSRYQKTVVVFTHDSELAEAFGQRIVTLSRGKLVDDRAAYMPAEAVLALDEGSTASGEDVEENLSDLSAQEPTFEEASAVFDDIIIAEGQVEAENAETAEHEELSELLTEEPIPEVLPEPEAHPELEMVDDAKPVEKEEVSAEPAEDVEADTDDTAVEESDAVSDTEEDEKVTLEESDEPSDLLPDKDSAEDQIDGESSEEEVL